MAGELQHFTVTIPSGTLKAAPATFSLAMPPRVVEEIEIVVPPGLRGEVGFQLASGGLQIVPASRGEFIVTDGEVIHWPLEDQITSGAWQLIGYNTGSFNHTLRVRFLVRVPPKPALVAAPVLIESTALSS